MTSDLTAPPALAPARPLRNGIAHEPTSFSSVNDEVSCNGDTVVKSERSGSAATVERLFREHAPRIYTIARRLLSNDDDAEKITRDVLLQAVRKLDSCEEDASFVVWLERLLIKVAMAHPSCSATRTDVPPVDSIQQFHGRGSNAEASRCRSNAPSPSKPLSSLIDDAIAMLSPIDRSVYVLADVDGMPNGKIGELLGLGLPKVKTHLHRARVEIRTNLAPHFRSACI